MQTQVPAARKPELRLTESAKRALVFAPHAAAVVQHQIEHAGFGAVVMRPHGDNYRLTLGRCYVAYWAAP